MNQKFFSLDVPSKSELSILYLNCFLLMLPTLKEAGEFKQTISALSNAKDSNCIQYLVENTIKPYEAQQSSLFRPTVNAV